VRLTTSLGAMPHLFNRLAGCARWLHDDTGVAVYGKARKTLLTEAI